MKIHDLEYFTEEFAEDAFGEDFPQLDPHGFLKLGFVVTKEEWSKGKTGKPHRKVLKAYLDRSIIEDQYLERLKRQCAVLRTNLARSIADQCSMELDPNSRKNLIFTLTIKQTIPAEAFDVNPLPIIVEVLVAANDAANSYLRDLESRAVQITRLINGEPE